MAVRNDYKEVIQLDENLWDELAKGGGNNGKTYSPHEKVLAVQSYYDTGSSNKASEETGVNANTLRAWMRMPWWKAVRKEIIKLNNQKLSIILTDTAVKAAEQLKDRVVNGEPVFDKDGKQKETAKGDLIYKPLSAHQLALDGLAIPLDKVLKLDMAMNNPAKNVTVDQVMKNLKDTFLQMVKEEREAKEPKVIESEVIENV